MKVEILNKLGHVLAVDTATIAHGVRHVMDLSEEAIKNLDYFVKHELVELRFIDGDTPPASPAPPQDTTDQTDDAPPAPATDPAAERSGDDAPPAPAPDQTEDGANGTQEPADQGGAEPPAESTDGAPVELQGTAQLTSAVKQGAEAAPGTGADSASKPKSGRGRKPSVKE